MTNVLVVSTVDHAERALFRHLRPDDAVKVVVPAVRQGFLDWLANDERAFSHAEEIAAQTAEALPAGAIEAKAGEDDISLAIQDALATFPADEIVVALHPDREQESSRRTRQATTSRDERSGVCRSVSSTSRTKGIRPRTECL